MNTHIQKGYSFREVSSHDTIKIEKIDLKGVHIEGQKKPLNLHMALNKVKDKTWIRM